MVQIVKYLSCLTISSSRELNILRWDHTTLNSLLSNIPVVVISGLNGSRGNFRTWNMDDGLLRIILQPQMILFSFSEHIVDVIFTYLLFYVLEFDFRRLNGKKYGHMVRELATLMNWGFNRHFILNGYHCTNMFAYRTPDIATYWEPVHFFSLCHLLSLA